MFKLVPNMKYNVKCLKWYDIGNAPLNTARLNRLNIIIANYSHARLYEDFVI